MSKGLDYVKGKIADLEDDLQHYTMVDKDKVKEHFIKCEFEELYSLEKELMDLEAIKKRFIITLEDFDLVKEVMEDENIYD